MPTRKPFMRELRCDLTSQEVADRADELGSALHRRAETEKAKADASASYAADLKAATSTINRLGEEVRTRSTQRPVECHAVPDFAEGVMETIRLDSGEVIARRPLEPDERQPELAAPNREVSLEDV